MAVGQDASATLDFDLGDNFSALRLPQQLRHLRHVGRDPPRLVLGEQLGRRSSPQLFLEHLQCEPSSFDHLLYAIRPLLQVLM